MTFIFRIVNIKRGCEKGIKKCVKNRHLEMSCSMTTGIPKHKHENYGNVDFGGMGSENGEVNVGAAGTSCLD
jgi:hypothetical protein